MEVVVVVGVVLEDQPRPTDDVGRPENGLGVTDQEVLQALGDEDELHPCSVCDEGLHEFPITLQIEDEVGVGSSPDSSIVHGDKPPGGDTVAVFLVQEKEPQVHVSAVLVAAVSMDSPSPRAAQISYGQLGLEVVLLDAPRRAPYEIHELPRAVKVAPSYGPGHHEIASPPGRERSAPMQKAVVGEPNRLGATVPPYPS